jgi:membrane protein
MQIPAQLELPKRVVQQTIDDEAPELAAGLAYRFLFALFPFAIFVAALAAFVSQAIGIGDPTNEILGAVGDNLPPDVASQIAPQLEQVLGASRPGLLSIGAIAALWAATSGISSVMSAMNKAYDVDETRNFFVKNGLALLLTLVGSIAILAAFVTIVGGSIVTEQVIDELGIPSQTWDAISLVRYPLVLALVAVGVAVLFRFGPNVAVSFRWTLVGGLVFALGWVIATALFGVYVANFSSYANTYGALGGVIVLMLWFYLTALLLLVAAEVTSVLAKSREPEKVDARRAETGSRSAAKDAKRAARRGIDPDAGAAPDRDAEPTPSPMPRLTAPDPLALAEPAMVVAREAVGAATGADARPRMSIGKRAGAFAILGVAAVAGALAGLLGGDDDPGATT